MILERFPTLDYIAIDMEPVEIDGKRYPWSMFSIDIPGDLDAIDGPVVEANAAEGWVRVATGPERGCTGIHNAKVMYEGEGVMPTKLIHGDVRITLTKGCDVEMLADDVHPSSIQVTQGMKFREKP